MRSSNQKLNAMGVFTFDFHFFPQCQSVGRPGRRIANNSVVKASRDKSQLQSFGKAVICATDSGTCNNFYLVLMMEANQRTPNLGVTWMVPC